MFVPMVFYYFIGKYFENKHYESIKSREARLINMSLIPSDFKDDDSRIAASGMVSGGVVIGSDPFKRYIASLVNLIGGRVSVFESLLDRARREAVLRMKERAEKINADAIINFRIETMSICSGNDAKPMGIVEVMAYGTAIKYKKE
jgi:uncharacterized protein YbjQ (UPF0145 family)